MVEASTGSMRPPTTSTRSTSRSESSFSARRRLSQCSALRSQRSIAALTAARRRACSGPSSRPSMNTPPSAFILARYGIPKLRP